MINEQGKEYAVLLERQRRGPAHNFYKLTIISSNREQSKEYTEVFDGHG